MNLSQTYKVLNTFPRERLKNSVHRLCPYVFSPGWPRLAEGEKCSKGRRRRAEKGNEKYRLMDRKLKFLSEQDGKREDDKEKRDPERRVIHFYGSKTHYHLIRAHTFLSV